MPEASNSHREKYGLVTPGIVPLKGASQKIQSWQNRLEALGVLDCSIAHLQHGGWLSAFLIAPCNAQNSVSLGNDGIEVLCDGYISDIDNGPITRQAVNSSADIIAELYRRRGEKFLSQLRGSYSALIIDKNRNAAFYFNDRRASRPSFYTTQSDERLIIAPESGIIAAADPDNPEVARTNICEFLISGRYWNSHTLFASIQKLPQANKLELTHRRHKFSRYWRVSFTDPLSETNYDAIVDEATHLFLQSTRRLNKIIKSPFLFLSGGIDCRVVLSCLIQERNTTLPLVAYGNENEVENDVQISKKIAEASGLILNHHPIPLNDWPSDAKRASESNDCIVEVVDAPALIDTWSQLSEKHVSFFNGDECFGWRPPVASTLEALNNNMMFNLDQVARLKDWINPSAKRDIADELSHTLEEITKSHDHGSHTDLRDALYYEERLANEVNANVANQLKYFEQARPLLDEDVLNFVSRLPVRLRTNKQLYASIIEKLSPTLSRIPLATSMSIPLATTFSSLMAENKLIANFCLDELDDLSAPLGELIETRKVKQIVEALRDSRPLPAVNSNWISRLPGAWRFINHSPKNRVHPVSLLLRLLNINFFLKKIENTRCRINRIYPSRMRPS